MQAKEMIMIYVKKKKDDDDDDDVEEGPAPTHQPGAVPGKRVLDKRCRSRRTGGTRSVSGSLNTSEEKVCTELPQSTVPLQSWLQTTSNLANPWTT